MTLLHFSLIVVTATQFALPVVGNYESRRDLAQTSLTVRQDGEPIVTYGYTDHSLHYYTGYQVFGKVEDPVSLLQFIQENKHFLIVTKKQKIGEFDFLEGFTMEILGKQGNFRLLRISRK